MIRSANELKELLESQDKSQFQKAIHEEVALEVWPEFIKKYNNLIESIILNKTIPAKILDELSYNLDNKIRFAVACKNKLLECTYERLSQDTDESIRMRIAYNKNTPKNILLTMKDDEWISIRNKVSDRLCDKILEYIYVAWFENISFPEGDQDREWPCVYIIKAENKDYAKEWGDNISSIYAKKFNEKLLKSFIDEEANYTIEQVKMLSTVKYGDSTFYKKIFG